MIECRPGALADDRGFPNDASDGLRGDFAAYGGPGDVYWVTWAELAGANWQETDASGTRSRASTAGDDSDWGRVWSVMRILGQVHGADNVRLVVSFH